MYQNAFTICINNVIGSLPQSFFRFDCNLHLAHSFDVDGRQFTFTKFAVTVSTHQPPYIYYKFHSADMQVGWDVFVNYPQDPACNSKAAAACLRLLLENPRKSGESVDARSCL